MNIVVLTSFDENYSSYNPQTYYWNGFGRSENYLNTYIEKNKRDIREQYLQFIDNLGEKNKSKKIINSIFGTDNFHDLWQMSLISEKCPNKSLVTSNCIKLLAFDRILKAKRPNIVRLNSNDVELFYSIKILCKSKNINLQYSFSNFIYLHLKKIDLIPNFLKTTYFIMKKFFSCFQFRKGGKKLNFKNQISIISYLLNYKIDQSGEKKGRLLSEYWPGLIDILFKLNKKINFVHLGVDSNAIKKFNNLERDIENFNNTDTNHLLVDRNLTFSVLFLALKDFLKIAIRSLMIRNVNDMFLVKNTSITFFPFMRRHWISSTRGSHLFNSIITTYIFDKLFSKLPKQNMGLYLYENQPWERALIGSWRKFNHGTLIGVEHTSGYLRYWDLRFYKSQNYYYNNKKNKLLCDYVCINGQLSKECLLGSGFPKERLLEVEALRFNYLNDYLKKTKRKKLSHQNKILLLSDGNYHTSKRLLLDLSKIIKEINLKNEITFKPHPGDINSEKLINNAKKMNLRISNSKLLSEIVCHEKIVIVGSGSASIEAYLLGKKVIVYCDHKKLNSSPVRNLKNINFVTNSNDLLIALNSKIDSISFKNKFFWLDNRLTKWKRLLSDHLN